ncbi:Uncharacterised protein [Staphylococcus aureus]|nr:Uncharacterised protein [Staphylococcus aureus]CPN02914.1 Uncharacterised protein [Staphylococcus aureus]
MSYTEIPATFACDQTASSVSPCSPIILASTLEGATPSSWLIKYCKRALSNTVPEPITRSAGNPVYSFTNLVKMSTGFAAIKKYPSKPLSITLLTMLFIILVFFSTNCKRVSPGF